MNKETLIALFCMVVIVTSAPLVYGASKNVAGVTMISPLADVGIYLDESFGMSCDAELSGNGRMPTVTYTAQYCSESDCSAGATTLSVNDVGEVVTLESGASNPSTMGGNEIWSSTVYGRNGGTVYVRCKVTGSGECSGGCYSPTVLVTVNNPFECTDGQTRDCPLQLGICSGSQETCTSGTWPGCSYGELYEDPEVSCDVNDNDCDGFTDESLSQSCSITNEYGTCYGLETCTTGSWFGCDAATPAAELCSNGVDDDCDGLTDNNDPDCITEPTDFIFQSLKDTVDYIYDNQYTPGAEWPAWPIAHDYYDQARWFPRAVQSKTMAAAATVYLFNHEQKYLDMAEDIARWLLSMQDPAGYFPRQHSPPSNPEDNPHQTFKIGQHLLLVSAITGDVEIQNAVKKGFDYQLANNWNVDHLVSGIGSYAAYDKINFNTISAGTLALACYLYDEPSYCSYADSALKWTLQYQYPSGAWSYYSSHYVQNLPQNENYQMATLSGFAEALVYMELAGYPIDQELVDALNLGFDDLHARSFEGTYYSSDDGQSYDGVAHSLARFGWMFTYMGSFLDNASYADWAWKQMDYIVNTAPSGQFPDGSWGANDITVPGQPTSTFETAITAGNLAMVVLTQAKPWDLMHIDPAVGFRKESSWGLNDVSLHLDDGSGSLSYKDSVSGINTQTTALSSWLWDVSDWLIFDTVVLFDTFDTDGAVAASYAQEADLFHISASRTGTWNPGEEKVFTYQVDQGLVPTRTDTATSVSYTFDQSVGALQTQDFSFVVPTGFVASGSVEYSPAGMSSFFLVDGIHMSLSQIGTDVAMQTNFFMPIPTGLSTITVYGNTTCSDGETRLCSLQDGVCAGFNETCTGGVWQGCDYSTNPFYEFTESLCDGLDNDCDGTVDSMTQSCGTDIGECVSGTETCTLGAWGSCVGEVGPVSESCDGLDNDCDGTNDNNFTDESCQYVCEVSYVWTAHGGNLNCCGNDAFEDSPYEVAETLCDGQDNDCDGVIDSMNRQCGTTDVGVCEYGQETCSTGVWGSCVGAVYSSTEVCGNGLDDDCDGFTDAADSDCVSISSCDDYCMSLSYSSGVCRKNEGFCNKNSEIYESGGDSYCPGGNNYDTCCCG